MIKKQELEQYEMLQIARGPSVEWIRVTVCAINVREIASLLFSRKRCHI